MYLFHTRDHYSTCQERKKFLEEEGVLIKGRKSVEDQKQHIRNMCCEAKIASIEQAILDGLSPSPQGRIVKKGTEFTGVFETGDETISKGFRSLSLCLSWIARMHHHGTKGNLRKTPLADRDKRNLAEEVPQWENVFSKKYMHTSTFIYLYIFIYIYIYLFVCLFTYSFIHTQFYI